MIRGRCDYRLLASKTILNKGDDDEFECIGYQRNIVKSTITHILAVIFLGLPYLIGHWKPEWAVNWYRSQCSLFHADTVLIKSKNDQDTNPACVVKIIVQQVSENFMLQSFIHRTDDFNDEISSSSSEGSDRDPLWFPSKHTFRYFVHHHCKYVWSGKDKTYTRLHGLDKNTKLHLFNEQFSHGLNEDSRIARQILYGANSIDVEVKSYLRLLFEEVLNAFYIFQIGSITLWSFDQYYYYAACIAFISLVSVVVSLLETRRQSQSLHDMVAMSNQSTAQVLRSRQIQEVSSTDLVPGDVLVIPSHGCIMPCDAVLLAGTCIVNESMLTGESVPVMKSALPHADASDEDDEYDPERHKRHTLFSGTDVIQTRYYGESRVLAVVVRTGFDTAKGSLVRSILYPKPIGFKFERDSKW